MAGEEDPVVISLALAVFTIGLLVVVMWDARRRDHRKQAELEHVMAGLITAKGRGTLDEIALIVDQNKHVLGRYHTRSREFREAGSYAEAVVWMRYGCEAIEKLAPDFVSALRSLRRLSRAASVIVALPPLRVYAYRSWKLRGVVGLGGVLHHLLATGQEQMRLRLRVLGYAFGLGLRWLRRSTDEVASRPVAGVEWRKIDALVFDLAVTGDETLLSAQRIVQALDAREIGKNGDERPTPARESVGFL